MKKVLFLAACLAILNSCNSNTKNQNEKQADTVTESEANSQEASDIFLNDINTDEALIATALMAAPEESRADAKVIGYNMAGEFVTLKEGSNEFICLADDPNKEGFSAACYHKNL